MDRKFTLLVKKDKVIKHFGLDRQYIQHKDELLDATDSVLSSGILVQGKYTDQLEKWLKLRTNCDYAITVHSGTQALEIIYRYYLSNRHYLSVKLVNKIRVPDFTFRATLNSILTACDFRSTSIELTDVDANGIMLQHDDSSDVNTSSCYVGLYGAPVERTIYAYSDVVDGAQHWLIANGIHGDTGLGMSISFDPTKNLPASGNGGAIVTNQKELYNFAKAYKNNGKGAASFVNDPSLIGTNSKMSELDCAHVLVRAKYIDQWQHRRSEIRKFYIDAFKDLPVRCLSSGFTKHADQKFVIAVDQDRTLLENHLINNQVVAMVHYDRPLSETKAAIVHKSVKCLDFLTTSTMLSRSVLSLPIYPELTDSEVEYVANTVKSFYG